MSAESPYNKKVETMRPQIREDMEVSQQSETMPDDVPHKEVERQTQRNDRDVPVSRGGIWGSGRSIEQQMEQIERLRARRKKLREATVVSHAELMQQDEDYKAIQQKIIAIRKRLNAIAVNGEAEEKKEEVQRLRDELARHFVAFKKAVQEKKKEQEAPQESREPSQAELEAKVDAQADVLNAQWEQGSAATPKEEEPTVAPSWHATAKVSYDDATLEMFGMKPKESTPSFGTQWNVTPEVTYSNDIIAPVQEASSLKETTSKAPEAPKQEARAYEQRLQERAEWREKKHAFDTAYKAYVAQAATKRAERSFAQKLQFWKKEEQPASLRALEQAYQDARRAYARSLHGAILDRIDARNPTRETDRDKMVLQAALANRFIIEAANDRLRAEGESLPRVEERRTLLKLHTALKKHGKLIKIAGYATVGGIALASGGVALAVAALAGKAVQTKITAAFMAGGLTAGALAGNVMSDHLISNADKKRDGAMRNAAQSFSSRALDRLEVEYLNAYRSHTKAVAQKKYIVGAGAAAGALGGALLAGNLEVPDELPSVPETPVAPVPELEIPVPAEEGVKPDDLLPEPSYPMPQEGPLEMDPYAIEHFEKEDTFETVPEMNDLLYTFQGGNIDTVSEALYETWKDNPAVLTDDVSKNEFLADMYSAIAEIEKDPELNAALMEKMHIDSWDIDKVLEGQTINLQPFFEYLNTRR